MPSFNRITLLGHLGAEPESRPTSVGRVMTRLRLATNHSWRDDREEWKEETDWHRIVTFGPAAERVQQRAHKGDLLLVEGRLRMRTWKADDGSKRLSPEVVASRIQILGRLSSQDGGRATAPPDSLDEDVPF